jgi:hypothetical protein
MMSVKLMFTFDSPASGSAAPRGPQRRGPASARKSSACAAGRLGRRDERVGEGEEQREADADHRDRVDERRDDEHLGLQHRGELRLTGSAFEEASTENAEADGGAERAEAEDDAHGQHGHTVDSCHSILLTKKHKGQSKTNQ